MLAYFINMEDQIQFTNIFKAAIQSFNKYLNQVQYS